MHSELFHINFNGFLGLQTVTIHTYAICIVLGAIMATFYVKRAFKKEFDFQLPYHFIYLLFIAGYVGGKVFLYLEDPIYYINNPKAILESFSGGFVFYGSFIFIIPTIVWYLKKHHLSIWSALDVFAISTAIIQIIGRIGCFFAGCCYGLPTTSHFGMSFPASGEHTVHPTQLYESFLMILILSFLLIYKNHKKFNGHIFLCYLGLYALSRFVLETFRGDARGQIINGYLSHSQLIAFTLLLVSILTYYKLNKQIT